MGYEKNQQNFQISQGRPGCRKFSSKFIAPQKSGWDVT